MIDKLKVKEVVERVYDPQFKIFMINSEDGEEFGRSESAFVSLGLTTSNIVLSNVRDTLEMAGYDAKLVKIASKRVNGQFMNYVFGEDVDNKFPVPEIDKEEVLDEKGSKELLELYRSALTPSTEVETLRDYVPKVSKLESLIEKIEETEDSWGAYSIFPEGGDFRLYHLFVNYMKKEDIEYRIGVLVKNRNIEENEGNYFEESDSD